MKDRKHDTTDHSNRHATDARLRSHGFRIHSRPDKGEPTWVMDGERFTEREAIELVEDLECTNTLPKS